MAKKLTRQKARQILEDGKAHGVRLTPKQKRFFEAVASGQPLK